MTDDGYVISGADPRIAAWAATACKIAEAMDTGTRRHGGTWFVGLDALPNAPDGSLAGTRLWLPWDLVCDHWHPAQVSIIYPGYPRRDPGETDVAHRFRMHRDAAHMDGLLAEGPDKRRYLREPHGFILGFPLNDVPASPLVVWPGSHRIMRDAFAANLRGSDPALWRNVDLTAPYQSARRRVFETCERVEIRAKPGQAVLLDRHLIHGVAPWQGPAVAKGRMIAYFRPLVPFDRWL